MTPRLRKYLELERLMLLLDEDGDPGADALRDAMDPIWYMLTADERRLLDERTIGHIKMLEAIRVPVDSRVFGPPPGPAAPRAIPRGAVKGWASAA